jgi:hypothetical protein
MDARIGPALFPAVHIRLRLFQAVETQPFQRRLLRMSDAGFDLAFAFRVLHPAQQSRRAIVLQRITVQRVSVGS